MVRDLIIVGAGGHGREVFGLVEALNAQTEAPGDAGRAWNVIGFAADTPPSGEAADRLARLGTEVVCPVDGVGELVEQRARAGTSRAVAVVAVGDGEARSHLVARLAAQGVELASALVHPTASVGPDVRLGRGVVVAAGSHLTTNVTVGVGVQVNVGCSLSHDVVLGDHVTLSPGCRLTGGVEVGDGAFFGVGAVVGPRVRVGAGARVGAGSVVLHDVEPGETVHGAPARPRASGTR